MTKQELEGWCNVLTLLRPDHATFVVVEPDGVLWAKMFHGALGPIAIYSPLHIKDLLRAAKDIALASTLELEVIIDARMASIEVADDLLEHPENFVSYPRLLTHNIDSAMLELIERMDTGLDAMMARLRDVENRLAAIELDNPDEP